MKITRENFNYILLSLIFSIIYFSFSMVIYPYYDNGDQRQYRLFYDNISQYGFVDGLDFYRSELGSMEPIYFFIVKLFSDIIPKDILFSFINGIFVYFIFFNLLKNKVAFYFLISLILNFYLLVLLFAAERLKISFLFLIMALTFSGSTRILFTALAFLSHIQSIFLIFILIFKNKLENLKKFFSFGKFSFILIITILLIFFLKNHISTKLIAYMDSGGFFDMVKSSIFVFLSLFYAHKGKRGEILVLGFPLVISAFFIGADRIVMMTYILFLLYGLKYKRGYNLMVFLSTAYFSWKGYNFLINIINYGDGFYH